MAKGGWAGVRIDWDTIAIESAVLRNDELDKRLRKATHDVADTARAMAPVVTGRYRDSIYVEPVWKRDRMSYRVVSNVAYAGKVESKYGTLRKALNAHNGR